MSRMESKSQLRAVVAVQDEELEKNGIKSVNDVECTMKAFAPDTINTIWTASNIEFKK